MPSIADKIRSWIEGEAIEDVCSILRRSIRNMIEAQKFILNYRKVNKRMSTRVYYQLVPLG